MSKIVKGFLSTKLMRPFEQAREYHERKREAERERRRPKTLDPALLLMKGMRAADGRSSLSCEETNVDPNENRVTKRCELESVKRNRSRVEVVREVRPQLSVIWSEKSHSWVGEMMVWRG